MNIGNQYQRFFRLKNGHRAEVREVAVEREEVAAVSALVQHNFEHHPSYAKLSSRAKQELIKCNDIEGVKGTCSHKDNILARNIRVNGEVVGYCVLRAKPDKGLTEIRRLHVAMGYERLGIGSFLLDDVKNGDSESWL